VHNSGWVQSRGGALKERRIPAVGSVCERSRRAFGRMSACWLGCVERAEQHERGKLRKEEATNKKELVEALLPKFFRGRGGRGNATSHQRGLEGDWSEPEKLGR